MIRLEQLPQVAAETLGGLSAPPRQTRAARRLAHGFSPRGRALAFALSLVLVMGLGAMTLSHLAGQRIPEVTHLQAGGERALPEGARMSGDVPRGSLVLSRDAAPAYQGVWARGSGGNFPLIRLDGRFYRLLNNPADVSALTGAALGQVALTTDEPALDRGGDTISSVVQAGEDVYALSGMGGGAVAARVKGQMRAFQRVAFAGNALVGGESLRDVLPAGARALQLSDVGTVSDPAAVSSLMDILLSQSSYQGSQLKETKQALLVQYPNGMVLQLSVSGSSLSACGTWSSPAFFEAFDQAVQ